MGALLLEELRAFTARLQCAEAGGDAGLGIDLLDAIEALKSVGCAVQAVITDGVAASIRADRRARGLGRATATGPGTGVGGRERSDRTIACLLTVSAEAEV